MIDISLNFRNIICKIFFRMSSSAKICIMLSFSLDQTDYILLSWCKDLLHVSIYFRLILIDLSVNLTVLFSSLTRYYSATIIQMTGIRDTSMAIWLAAMTAGVNFVFTILGVWLVERIGRRPLILGSLTGN